MNHAQAIKIFEEIRSRPYTLSTKPGVPSDNCYFKGIELLKRLGELGYAVRGHVGETYWDSAIIPQSIIDLYPTRFLVTHFYVEAEIDGSWRALDPSFDHDLAKVGFRVAEWSGANAPCFNITKHYTQEENIAYQSVWADPSYAVAYFSECAEFLRQLNAWFERVRV